MCPRAPILSFTHTLPCRSNERPLNLLVIIGNGRGHVVSELIVNNDLDTILTSVELSEVLHTPRPMSLSCDLTRVTSRVDETVLVIYYTKF